EKLIRWLVLPANRLVAGGMRKALGLLERLTGAGFMSHLFDFASSLLEVREPFLENLRGLTSVMRSRDCGFVLVSTATPEVATEAARFIDEVRAHGFHFEGVAL